MLYLIDANVLIRAHEDYYPLDRVPQFWTWLERESAAGRIKMPLEIHNEIAISRGALKDWICERHVKQALILDEEADAVNGGVIMYRRGGAKMYQEPRR